MQVGKAGWQSRVMATETPFVRGALEALHVQGVREDAVNEPLKGLARVP